ncbi:L,D-transpeptidase [Brunnivagina elsteri]|uniref:L,D-transpeptidase n=1 Tax=Brunnivagina elsteri CCALA 953 TaxID=987040 RepID=A0A2A2TF43_9CYAN|nr:L,D-transpeptidase [Calothrix elsteri]PAX52311.1 L,D-transpeptidase [Calothrix elsteri CCALA 953]
MKEGKKITFNYLTKIFVTFASATLVFGVGELILFQPGVAVGKEVVIVAQSLPILVNTNDDLPVAPIPENKPNEVVPEVEPAPDEIHLVVKLKAKKVYVYQGNEIIASYAIAVGKPGWETPKGTYRVFEQEINPIFKSFKTGRIINAGAENPLGPRWIGIWTDGKTRLGFHGTNQPELIGKAVSHGCIRMRNQDVTALYEKVKVGTVVKVEP